VSAFINTVIAGLFIKRKHGAPMERVTHLDMCRSRGILGDINPGGFSPRQACITISESLIEQDVSWPGSRANIILSGDDSNRVNSGGLLTIGNVALRVTMRCEPCSHGANLADVKAARFRKITRYLAIVISCGRVSVGDLTGVHPEVFAVVPEDFRTRCAWAVDSIPKGRVVNSVEFLNAIGASTSYARVLPRWIDHAKGFGQPVHRVLTANLTAPSWAPDALSQLAREGVELSVLTRAQFPLTRRLWFNCETQGGSAVSTNDTLSIIEN
jgi:hypothetical protein